jgi:predicted acyltransferase
MADPVATPAEPSPPPVRAKVLLPGRVVSLDALRGFDMLWILGADSLGSALAALHGGPVTTALAGQLEHARWEGFHFYDLIFPLFVFMVGVSLVFSLTRIVAKEGRDAAIVRVVKRSVLLYLLGIFVYGGFSTPFAEIRLLGVLQRIALCYGVTGILFIFFRPRTLGILAGVILLGYWALLALVPAPGQTAATYAEGKNIVNWFDLHFLPLRKWDVTHDPEGILSTFPALATCILGVFAGLWLADPKRTDRQKVTGLAVAGISLLAVGYGWGFVFPIIKKLWTSSYVFVAGGWSLLLLATFFGLVDMRGWRRWAEPFIWIGMNPITLYLAAHVIAFDSLAGRLVGGTVAKFLDAHVMAGIGALMVSVVSVLLCVWLARLLYKKQIFIRL